MRLPSQIDEPAPIRVASFRTRLVFGVIGPRRPVLGADLAGIVEAVGPKVSRFRPGDAVIAFTDAGFGSHAEYRTMPETGMIARKPANLTFDEAASLPFGSMTALPFLRDKAKVRRGDEVLIVGVSGAIGTSAVQIARHLGAMVTAVTSRPIRVLWFWGVGLLMPPSYQAGST